ncbi:gluconokinase [Aquabacterium sp.]|uniref:gluconokinase n=1 Tax=Aquabacterium sp. TaxID=1872578 RepID=UPI002CFE32D7|nr:gluconokinase [Aquabacterium sp.]HSW08326.1 gluconokinase [Aquabacterium sp.]
MTSLVVMGVSGCGKSRVGALTAERLGLPLVEGDEFHSEANRALMHQGIPLTDAHRADWLAALGAELQARPGGAVLTCSSLKASYRDRLRAAAPGLRFAWLDLDAAAALARVAQRSEHFFPAGLVATQFDALESPLGEPGVLRLDALLPPELLAEHAVRWISDTDERKPSSEHDARVEDDIGVGRAFAGPDDGACRS